MRKLFAVILLAFLVSSCGVEQPDGIQPVKNFNVKKYMGRWYENVRLDHRFERGMNSVTADYSRNANGSITIKNSGYMVKRQEWRAAEGVAAFVETEKVGFLKVSYIRPFYYPYVIFKVDEDYEWAFVAGKDMSFLWLLSREPEVDWDVRQDFISEAKKLGFDTSQLIFVEHI